MSSTALSIFRRASFFRCHADTTRSLSQVGALFGKPPPRNSTGTEANHQRPARPPSALDTPESSLLDSRSLLRPPHSVAPSSVLPPNVKICYICHHYSRAVKHPAPPPMTALIGETGLGETGGVRCRCCCVQQGLPIPLCVVDNRHVFSSLALKCRNQDRPLQKRSYVQQTTNPQSIGVWCC